MENKQNRLFTEINIKSKNIYFNNLLNNKRLPIINYEKERKSSYKSFETLINKKKDKSLMNFYKTIHSNNKPLDIFPKNSKNNRFIILNLEINSFSENDFTNLDKNVNIISINAMEMINMELTGIQFHAYFNKEKDNDKNENQLNNKEDKIFLSYLSDYFAEREDNNKKLLEQLLNFIGKSFVICHNALNVIKFINRELKKYNLPEIKINKSICTLRMMRLKSFKNPEFKFNGLKINDLCKDYSINIEEKYMDNGLIKALALSLCIIKMIQEEINHESISEYNNKNSRNDNYSTYEQKKYETEQNNDHLDMNYFEVMTESNKDIEKLNINTVKKINNIKSPQIDNKIYSTLKKNYKEFNEKYKIAKSFNKYKYFYEMSDNSKIYKTLKDNNRLLFNNFTNKNILIKKNMFSDNYIFKNNLEIDSTN